jgi:hypothetical protein
VELKLNITPAWQGQQPANMMENNNFCWLHGYQVHNKHTSASYKSQKEGQMKEATKNNTMGGVKWGKE